MWQARLSQGTGPAAVPAASFGVQGRCVPLLPSAFGAGRALAGSSSSSAPSDMLSTSLPLLAALPSAGWRATAAPAGSCCCCCMGAATMCCLARYPPPCSKMPTTAAGGLDQLPAPDSFGQLHTRSCAGIWRGSPCQAQTVPGKAPTARPDLQAGALAMLPPAAGRLLRTPLPSGACGRVDGRRRWAASSTAREAAAAALAPPRPCLRCC